MALLTPHAPRRGITLSWPARPRLSARAGAALLGMLFALLTADALLRERAPFDLRLIRQTQALDLPAILLRPVDTLTSSTGAVSAWLVVLAIFVAARWWIAAAAALTLPLGGVLNEGVGEVLVGRTRPGADEVERVIGHTDAASFPSGHVMGAVMLYGLLYVVADRITWTPLRRAVKAGAVAVIVIAGVGRIWYGAHWPSDVLGAYALGGLLLMLLAVLYRRLDATSGHLPLIRAAVPAHDERTPHAHALTSLVLFHGDTVSKVYAPGLLPRAIYWLAFQAPFPYIDNLAALRAARHRRNLAALLTEYWFGERRVARLTSIDRTPAGYALTSEFVAGSAPADRAAAKRWLVELRARFEDAGLPTWQIDPRQPRAVDNVLETADGRYMIVDLESGLVAPIASLVTWRRALKRGLAPLYDDVFFDITRGYIAREETAMRAALGEAQFAALLQTLDAAERETALWHAGEPRLWGRLLRTLGGGFTVRRWPAWGKAKFAGSQEKAQAWMATAIDTWEREGRVTAAEARSMRAQMETAEFQAMMPHLGAHLVITVIFRFPFGSIARVLWSAGALGVATWRLLTRRIDRVAWRQAWSIHSPLVATLSLIPGFGSFAYLAAKPIRSNRLLLRATGDAVLQKLPKRSYERSGLRRLLARPAGTATAPPVVAAAPADLEPAPIRYGHPNRDGATSERPRPPLPSAANVRETAAAAPMR